MGKRFLIRLLSWIARFILSLRYRIIVSGKEHLFLLKKKKGVLFLPNHPALVDPIILAMHTCPAFHARPLVIEYIYRQTLVRKFVDLVDALFHFLILRHRSMNLS